MAGMSQAFTAMVQEKLGFIPAGLSTAISALTADQRDRYVLAYIYASEEQRQQPAEAWMIREDDQEPFAAFLSRMQAVDL
ncbi:hypothetical protein Q7F20_09275 [Curtobacterium sp. A7_M15]|uniref:hypothetical protein n=1 Tax=Curtobacterium sp. A7_M15 TaxID=3065241 RepID=UPI002737909C|nr:hypothetical protein [Curtobacterium sp. A7_M15]MDP4333562.1 hypothetical protein [Curtobacterium sp. A7_M15]